MDLASTSALAGKKINETFSGVEALTLMRRGFGGDLSVNDNTLPVSGLWADHAFFKVFSFHACTGQSLQRAEGTLLAGLNGIICQKDFWKHRCTWEKR